MGDLTTQSMPPFFSRTDVATLLKCSPLTVANRERKKTYPEPTRTSSNHRIYNLSDIFNLMWITDKNIWLKPIIAIMYEKGYTDIEDVKRYILKEYQAFQENLAETAQNNKEAVEKTNE